MEKLLANIRLLPSTWHIDRNVTWYCRQHLWTIVAICDSHGFLLASKTAARTWIHGTAKEFDIHLALAMEFPLLFLAIVPHPLVPRSYSDLLCILPFEGREFRITSSYCIGCVKRVEMTAWCIVDSMKSNSRAFSRYLYSLGTNSWIGIWHSLIV